MAVQLHTCGPSCAADCRQGEEASRAVARRDRKQLTVDFHCHALVPAVETLVADCPQKRAEGAAMITAMGAASAEHNRTRMLPAAFPGLTDATTRLVDMDAMGVDVQVVSPSPSQYYYWAEEGLAEQVVRVENEAIADLCASHGKRLVGLGTVALQHPRLAIEQIQYAVATLGLRGVEISTAIGDRELDDPDFESFWAKVQDLDCVVFIHPFGTSLGERVNRYYLQNIIGQPLETTVALSHLIFGGVLDRYPGLKIVAAHGGGYLPAYSGRSDHGHQVRPEIHSMAGALKHKPSEYLRQIWFDTLVYQPQNLRALADQVGASQLVIGSDYPFDMGAYDVHRLVEAVPGLSDEERAQILGGNACRLLGLDGQQ